MVFLLPVAMAAIDNGPPSTDGNTPGETYILQQMSFANAKIVAQQMGDPEVNMLLQQLEEYNIPDNAMVYVITSQGSNTNIGMEQLNATHLLSLGNATLIFHEVRNATQGLIGLWTTYGNGYGWPPGIHVVRSGEAKLFLWYYPSDPNATTIIWIPAFPIPMRYHGPHAGGVIATKGSWFRAPTIDAAPGLVAGWGTFIFGICIPLGGTVAPA